MQIKLPHLGHFCFLPPQRALFSGYAMPNFQRKYWDCYYCWRYSAYFPKSCKTVLVLKRIKHYGLPTLFSSIQQHSGPSLWKETVKTSLESGFFSVLVLILPVLRKHLRPLQCQWLYGANLQKLGVPPVSPASTSSWLHIPACRLVWGGTNDALG